MIAACCFYFSVTNLLKTKRNQQYRRFLFYLQYSQLLDTSPVLSAFNAV